MALSLAGALVQSCKSEGPASVAASSAPVAEAANGASPPVRVEAGDDGFRPARVVLGGAKQVTFRRTSDSTCATEVVFPELGIEKKLPLNTDVVIDLPANAPGELGFQCGMGMYKSKLVAR